MNLKILIVLCIEKLYWILFCLYFYHPIYFIHIHHLIVCLEILKFKLGCFLHSGKSRKTGFFQKMAFLPYGFWRRYVSSNEYYFWIAQLKSYPMIYNMTYFDHICVEKNPKNRNMHIFIFWPLLDFDPPGGGGHELSKSVKIWIKANFDMRNPNLRSKIKKFENDLFQFRRFLQKTTLK